MILDGGIAPILENKYYYTSENGWKEIDGEWYIFDSRGYALQDAWYYDESDKSWYYLDLIARWLEGVRINLCGFGLIVGVMLLMNMGRCIVIVLLLMVVRVDESGAWVDKKD